MMAMYYRLMLVVALLAFVYAAKPPFSRSKSTPVTVTVGQNATLICPVTDNVEFVDWFKEDQKLEVYDHRLKFKNNGVLKIIKVTKEDEGHYRCHAINGFGEATGDVKVHVVDLHPTFDDNGYEFNNNNFPPDTKTVEEKEKPRFKESQLKDAARIVHRPTESSVVFRCHPQGNPPPIVQWYKDGNRLTEINRYPRIKIFRWKIEINYLNLSDSGNYVCEAQNLHGFAYMNYTLRVARPVISQSEFMGQDPVNTTVIEGGGANFQCRVRSSVKPHISWLKLVPEDELRVTNNKHFIPFDGKYYQVLNSTDVLDHPDGSFLNKLHIERASLRDTGKYVCLAANTKGYIYRVAHLQIIPKSISEAPNGISGNPVTVIVVVSLTALMMLTCTIGALRYARCPRVMDPNPSITSQQLGTSRKRLLIQNVGIKEVVVDGMQTQSSTRVKVHHHPKTHHHHYHQHSHHLGSFKY